MGGSSEIALHHGPPGRRRRLLILSGERIAADWSLARSKGREGLVQEGFEVVAQQSFEEPPRARIGLGAADGKSNRALAKELKTSRPNPGFSEKRADWLPLYDNAASPGL